MVGWLTLLATKRWPIGPLTWNCEENHSLIIYCSRGFVCSTSSEKKDILKEFCVKFVIFAQKHFISSIPCRKVYAASGCMNPSLWQVASSCETAMIYIQPQCLCFSPPHPLPTPTSSLQVGIWRGVPCFRTGSCTAMRSCTWLSLSASVPHVHHWPWWWLQGSCRLVQIALVPLFHIPPPPSQKLPN